MPVQAPAESGDQDKGPADTLLPDVTGGAPVPRRVDSVQIDEIPHPVIQKHADHCDPPQRVDPADSFSSDKLRFGSCPPGLKPVLIQF